MYSDISNVFEITNFFEKVNNFLRFLTALLSGSMISAWRHQRYSTSGFSSLYLRSNSRRVSAQVFSSSSSTSSPETAPYDHLKIEQKWQKYWDDNKTFRSTRRTDPLTNKKHKKKYILDMFPYPSGSGLHVGHPEGYTATDIMSRYYRMNDYDVLHPMGWDAFGLPAEQHAINTGTHPNVTTKENIAIFKSQLKSLGFSYDW